MKTLLIALSGIVSIPFLSCLAHAALDLRVSALKSGLRPGEATELIVTLANPDNTTRTNVTVDFVMPAGFSGNQVYAYPAIARGFSTLTPAELVGWDIPQMLPGAIVHQRIMIVADSGGTALPNGTVTPFSFIARVGGVESDNFSRSLTVDAGLDLDAAISLETAGPAAGVPFEVVIAYGNRGVLPQSNLSLSLQLPASISFLDASATPVQNGNSLTWARGNLNPGEVGQIVLRLQSTVAGTLGELRDLAMTATSSNQIQGAQAVLSPGTVANLQLSLGHSGLPLASTDNPVQITASITNNRNFPSADLKVRFLAPARMSGNAVWTDETVAAGFSVFETGEVIGWDFAALGARADLQARTQLWPSATGPAGSVIAMAYSVTDNTGAQALSLLAIPVHGSAALNLELATGDSGFTSGEDFRFTLSIGNRSASPISNIRPQVILPAGLVQGLQTSGGAATILGDVLTFDLITLAPGSVAERVVTGRVAPTVTAANVAPGGLSRRISGFADTASSTHLSALATLTRTVQDLDVLDLAISADRAFLRDNEPSRIQMTVTNRGAVPLTNLVLDTLLPEAVEGHTAWALPLLSRGFSTLTPAELCGWNIPSLAPGASLTYELLLYADATAGAGSVIAVKARVRDSSQALLDDAQVNLNLVQNAAPELLLSCDNPLPVAGEMIRFSVNYGNPTPTPMTSTNLTVALPRGLEFVFGESGITYSPDPVFPAEGGGTLTLLNGTTLQPNVLGELIFYARPLAGLPAGSGLPVHCSLAAAVLQASSGTHLVVSPLANLKLAVSHDGLPLTATSRAEYVFSVTNQAAFDLTNVVVRFLFPPKSDGITTSTSPTVNIGFSTLTEGEETGWEIPLLAAGTTRFLRCSINEAAAADGQIGSLVARADASDGSQALAHSKVLFDSDARLDLALTAGPHAVLPGGTFNVSLALGNRSGAPIANTSVRVDFPGELLEIVNSPSSPPLVGNALLWNCAGLAPGEAATVPLTLRWRTGVPVGRQMKIQARTVSSTEMATADLVLAAAPPHQAELIPSITTNDTTPATAQLISLTLAPHNTSSFQRGNLVADFLVPNGFGGNVSNANPSVDIGFSALELNERIGWIFPTFAPALQPSLIQPMTFTVAAGSTRGSVIPVIAGVADDGQGSNLASLAYISDPAAFVSLTPINPVGNDPTDLDSDGIADIYETGTGVFVSEFDTGTSPTDSDSDNDGIVDGKELESGFFNPTRDDSFVVAFFEQRTRDLAFGTPVLTRDPDTGEVALKIGLRESPNLGSFTKRPILPAEATISDGDILLKFLTTEDAFFYRFHGSDAD